MAESWRKEERGHLLVGRSEGAQREGDLAVVRVILETLALPRQCRRVATNERKGSPLGKRGGAIVE